MDGIFDGASRTAAAEEERRTSRSSSPVTSASRITQTRRTFLFKPKTHVGPVLPLLLLLCLEMWCLSTAVSGQPSDSEMDTTDLDSMVQGGGGPDLGSNITDIEDRESPLSLAARRTLGQRPGIVQPRTRCPLTPNGFRNGQLRVRARGTLVRFKCNVGFEIVGKRYATCMARRWSNPLPICAGKLCRPRPPAPRNGRVVDLYRGAGVHFLCNPGYSLVGSRTTLCLDNTHWDKNAPSCHAKPSNASSLSCDFEDSGLCLWERDPETLDWRRREPTTDPGTGLSSSGPFFDHTFGEGSSGFLLKLDFAPYVTTDEGRLYSPVLGAEMGNSCFIFWYHVYGRSGGSLRIFIKTEARALEEIEPTWSVSSSNQTMGAREPPMQQQRQQWKQGLVQVPPMAEAFQLVIRASVNQGFDGPIALDDLELRPQTNCSAVVVANQEESALDNSGVPSNSSSSSGSHSGQEDSVATDKETDDVEAVSCANKCNQSQSSISLNDHLPDNCSCLASCQRAKNCCSNYDQLCNKSSSSSGGGSSSSTTGPGFEQPNYDVDEMSRGRGPNEQELDNGTRGGMLEQATTALPNQQESNNRTSSALPTTALEEVSSGSRTWTVQPTASFASTRKLIAITGSSPAPEIALHTSTGSPSSSTPSDSGRTISLTITSETTDAVKQSTAEITRSALSSGALSTVSPAPGSRALSANDGPKKTEPVRTFTSPISATMATVMATNAVPSKSVGSIEGVYLKNSSPTSTGSFGMVTTTPTTATAVTSAPITSGSPGDSSANGGNSSGAVVITDTETLHTTGFTGATPPSFVHVTENSTLGLFSREDETGERKWSNSSDESSSRNDGDDSSASSSSSSSSDKHKLIGSSTENSITATVRTPMSTQSPVSRSTESLFSVIVPKSSLSGPSGTRAAVVTEAPIDEESLPNTARPLIAPSAAKTAGPGTTASSVGPNAKAIHKMTPTNDERGRGDSDENEIQDISPKESLADGLNGNYVKSRPTQATPGHEAAEAGSTAKGLRFEESSGSKSAPPVATGVMARVATTKAVVAEKANGTPGNGVKGNWHVIWPLAATSLVIALGLLLVLLERRRRRVGWRRTVSSSSRGDDLDISLLALN